MIDAKRRSMSDERHQSSVQGRRVVVQPVRLRPVPQQRARPQPRTQTVPPPRPIPRAATPPPPLARRLQRWQRTPKAALTLVFVPLLLLGGTATGWGAVLPQLCAALAGNVLVDLLLGRLVRHRWTWPSSALLSGLIVAFILAPVEPHGITFLVGALASGSKYLLRLRRDHLFNPAAFALVVSVPLFGTGQSWWGALATLPPIAVLLLLAGGAFLLERLNKFPLALSFLGSYFSLLAFGGLLAPGRVAELFRSPFLNAACFLACFMLTDPPTSPGRRNDQVWFGSLVAIIAVVAQLVGVGQIYLLVGLLAGNLALSSRRLISRWRVGASAGQATGRPPGPGRATSQ
jgi:Na+-translocating ferredoxin:NAD+ oxidoreductase RnfD subunit